MGNFPYPLLGKIPDFGANILFPKELGDTLPPKWINSRKSREYSPKIERISESHIYWGISPIYVVVFPKDWRNLR